MDKEISFDLLMNIFSAKLTKLTTSYRMSSERTKGRQEFQYILRERERELVSDFSIF